MVQASTIFNLNSQQQTQSIEAERRDLKEHLAAAFLCICPVGFCRWISRTHHSPRSGI